MTLIQMLELFLLLSCGGLSAFCFILARRLRRLNDLETGIGAAIAVLVSEISRLEQSLVLARQEASAAAGGLEEAIARAKDERAYWVLQRNFASDPAPASRPRRRRLRQDEATHA